jgi:hypothetical protein
MTKYDDGSAKPRADHLLNQLANVNCLLILQYNYYCIMVSIVWY